MNNHIPSFDQFLNESINESKSYKIEDFPLDALITFKDNEVWKVVKAGMRASNNRVKSDEITVKPYNDLAKKRNISLPIDLTLTYLNDNVKKIEK